MHDCAGSKTQCYSTISSSFNLANMNLPFIYEEHFINAHIMKQRALSIDFHFIDYSASDDTLISHITL